LNGTEFRGVTSPHPDLKDSIFKPFCRDLWRARIVWEIRTGRRDKEGKKTPVVYEGDEEGV
jgi:hypothetical protein